MKKYFIYTIVLAAFLLANISCSKDWLDINVDPNNPSSSVAPVSSRLPWIQHHYLYAQGTAGARAGFITQMLTYTYGTATHSMSAGWNPVAGVSTTPYQFFFVASAANLKDLEEKAMEEEAWHYVGAAKAIRALGFMLMVDWYGEMPYTEALGEAITPVFDDGKTIFEGCLQDIDEAIEYFNREQPVLATPLDKGDSWNNGDVNKWIKMCYGLKARWLNNLSKKTSIYDADEILSVLEKAPQSNADNTVIKHIDVAGDNVGDVLFSDPLMASIVFSNVGMNVNTLVTKWYEDLLVNFDGKTIEDPRANKLIPMAQFGTNKEYVRSKGVDMQSNIRMNNGPIVASYNATNEPLTSNGRTVAPHSYYINSANSERWGDTTFVSFRSDAIGYYKSPDDIYKWGDGRVASTSSFYSRPDAPNHFLCYHEMCFIKAEILFNKGDKAGAFQAYKQGVQAHIDLMNEKLSSYGNVNPSKSPMDQDDIENFMNNALGTAGDISLGKIMMQKFIALSFSQQNWNDMRRMDYSEDIYKGWGVPFEYYQTAQAQTKIPLGKDFRRIMQVSHEMNYNAENFRNSHPNAASDDIWSFPVWWDIAD